MPDFVIACLSQKGGVGKSTLSRMIATAYAKSEWTVKIADFNTKQKTSVDWSAMRLEQGIGPEVPTEAFSSVKTALKQDYQLMVCDGRPDSDTSSLEIAKAANVVVIPTGVTLDDLKPQVLFANELRTRGIPRQKIIFVLNKTADSTIAVQDAIEYIQSVGYNVTKTDLPWKTGYQIAQNSGRSVMETTYPSLNEKAVACVNEIIRFANVQMGVAA